MGTAQIPTLADIEAEIERRGLNDEYAQVLADAVTYDAKGDAFRFIVTLTRLTTTQKTQAALKVLFGELTPKRFYVAK